MVSELHFSFEAWRDSASIDLDITGSMFRFAEFDGEREIHREGNVDSEKLEAALSSARRWKDSYFRPVTEGENWSLDWVEDGKAFSRQGNNAFPPDWEAFLALVKEACRYSKTRCREVPRTSS